MWGGGGEEAGGQGCVLKTLSFQKANLNDSMVVNIWYGVDNNTSALSDRAKLSYFD